MRQRGAAVRAHVGIAAVMLDHLRAHADDVADLRIRQTSAAQVDYIGDAKASPNIRGRESAARTRPIDGAGGLEAAAPSKKEVRQQNDFDVLAAIWQRPWPDDERESRKAFVEACREADPEKIIEGARAWVAAADDPRYLKPLPKWLAARLWEKAPPTKRQKHNKHRSLGDAMREAGERKATDTDEVIHYK